MHKDRIRSAKVDTQQNWINSKVSEFTPNKKCHRLHRYHNHGPAYSTFEHAPRESSIDPDIERRVGMVPLAAELCHRQSFADRITLFQSNWIVLTQ